jgi:S-adenosylmethionine/arginine decarboxylase-like enzyme
MAACDKAAITSKEKLATFVKDLVVKIDMKAYGEPIIEHFATHDPAKGGYSLVQLIETSAITGHFVDENGDAYLDIFSCKPFTMETALEVVSEHLKPANVKHIGLARSASAPTVQVTGAQ